MTDKTRLPSRSGTQPSRRQFLATTASMAGAGTILGACQSLDSAAPLPIAPPTRPPAADESIRIGVIGTGGMGTSHCMRIIKLAKDAKENVQVVAVSDVCGPRMEKARAACAEQQEIEVEGYGDYKELLARDDIHGVLIASPEHWHQQMAEDAIGAGKDVYVEKPMTLRLAEAKRLLRVAQANPKVIVQVGTQFTTHQKYHVARQLIAEGQIGKPTFSQTSYCRNNKDGEWLYKIMPWTPDDGIDWAGWCGPLGEQPWNPEVYYRWRRYSQFSTGIIGDLLVHMMTPMVFALDQGWPTRVVASGGHYHDKAMDNHDQVNLVVQFEKEHTMTVCGSTCNEKGSETMIRGHKATLYLGSKDCLIRPERPYAEEIDEETFTCPPERGDQDRLRLNWLACMRSREQNLSTVELGTKIMVIVDLATRSMWEGKAFEFDAATMTARAV